MYVSSTDLLHITVFLTIPLPDPPTGTYYAAQLGLDLKSHEPGAREFLLSLITLLENVSQPSSVLSGLPSVNDRVVQMKTELGANDAIDNEAAGAAYVENFAVKVFSLADNEDRRGESSR